MPNDVLDIVESNLKLGFFMVKNSVIESYDLTIGAFWLYSCLVKYSYGKGHCFPSVATLAKLTRAGPKERGVSEQAIRNWTDELVSKKLITVNEQPGTRKVYTLLEIADVVTPQPQLTPQPELTGQPGFAEPLNQGLPDPSTRVEQKNNKLRRRKEEDKDGVFVLPDWVPKDAWEGFEEMRKNRKKPLTNRARGMILTSLKKFQMQGMAPGAVLDQSTVNCWQDVFALRENGGNGNGHGFINQAEQRSLINESNAQDFRRRHS